jgi:hypothetical protein
VASPLDDVLAELTKQRHAEMAASDELRRRMADEDAVRRQALTHGMDAEAAIRYYRAESNFGPYDGYKRVELGSAWGDVESELLRKITKQAETTLDHFSFGGDFTGRLETTITPGPDPDLARELRDDLGCANEEVLEIQRLLDAEAREDEQPSVFFNDFQL